MKQALICETLAVLGVFPWAFLVPARYKIEGFKTRQRLPMNILHHGTQTLPSSEVASFTSPMSEKLVMATSPSGNSATIFSFPPTASI